jgi:hypothetical protein
VIQDLDGPLVGFGAFWGEVQTTIHKGLGCLGVVTDGCVRDITMMAPGFQVLAGSITPSHAWVHLVDIGGAVNVGGMMVSDGDLIHADRHGAVVIPARSRAQGRGRGRSLRPPRSADSRCGAQTRLHRRRSRARDGRGRRHSLIGSTGPGGDLRGIAMHTVKTAFAALAALLLCCVPAAAQQAVTGTWVIRQAAPVAPWVAQGATPPSDREQRRLAGGRVTFRADRISGPAPARLPRPALPGARLRRRHAVPGQSHPGRGAGDGARLHRTADQDARDGCAGAIDFHMLDDNTMSFALNNRIYTLDRSAALTPRTDSSARTGEIGHRAPPPTKTVRSGRVIPSPCAPARWWCGPCRRRATVPGNRTRRDPQRGMVAGVDDADRAREASIAPGENGAHRFGRVALAVHRLRQRPAELRRIQRRHHRAAEVGEASSRRSGGRGLLDRPNIRSRAWTTGRA